MLSESRDAGHSGDIAKKLTVKLWGKGVYAKNDKGSAATQYFTRHAGQFIYSKLDFLNSAFGVVPQELESYESTADLPAFDCIAVDPYFMFYRAIQPSFYLTNGMIADGSRKAKRIHVETFLDMPLDLPSIEEQKKVASYFKKTLRQNHSNVVFVLLNDISPANTDVLTLSQKFTAAIEIVATLFATMLYSIREPIVAVVLLVIALVLDPPSTVKLATVYGESVIFCSVCFALMGNRFGKVVKAFGNVIQTR